MVINLNIKQNLIKKLIYLGHKVNRINTSMLPYILNIKNNHYIINLEKTSKFLKLSKKIITKFQQENKKILFIGTDSISKVLIKKYALLTHNYYINSRWIGGLLTNWNTNKLQISMLNNLKNLIEINSFSNLNLKEINKLKKDYEKLKYLYEGIQTMNTLPDLVLFTNPKRDNIALQECIKLGIPIIALIDINTNIQNISYPIPLNL